MSFETFDYKLPDDTEFHKTLRSWLKVKQEDDLFELLREGKCFINSTNSYSRNRWNAMGAIIHFYILLENMKKINEDTKPRLIEACNEVLPKEDGFDVVEVEFSPLITTPEAQDSLTDDLEKNLNSMRSKIIGAILIALPVCLFN